MALAAPAEREGSTGGWVDGRAGGRTGILDDKNFYCIIGHILRTYVQSHLQSLHRSGLGLLMVYDAAVYSKESHYGVYNVLESRILHPGKMVRVHMYSRSVAPPFHRACMS